MSKRHHPTPKPGDTVEITARRCSPRQQPLLAIGTRFKVEGIDRLKDGTPVLTLAHPTRRRATLRANAARFDWRIITREDLREERFERDCKESAEQIHRHFSAQEQLQIAVVPLILNHVAWTYAFKAVALAAQYRIDMLKKHSRAVRELESEYRYQLSRDLDSLHLGTIEHQTDEFLQAIAADMTIFYFTVNSEFKKKMPDFPYDDLRTFAIMAIIIIRAAAMHNHEMDALINRRTGRECNTIQHPIMGKLRQYMEAMAGDPLGKFDYATNTVDLCRRILRNNIKRIDFTLN